MARHVVVVGQGLIGLATARALAGRGATVEALESAVRSREASWAAAGILGAGSESTVDGPLFRFLWDSLRDWRSTSDALLAETAVDPRLEDTGTLLTALDDAERTDLESRARFLADVGFPASLLSGDEARRREPALGPSVRAALWLGEARLDNRRLWDAYEASCRGRGVLLRQGLAAESIEVHGGRATGVVAGGRRVPADAVVLAAGAWSETLARTVDLDLPSVPVKGQMARVEVAGPTPPPDHVVKHGLPYAVPRTRGTLVLGTTSEEVGFDRSVDAGSVERFVRDVARVVPAVERARVVETWAGFRPRLADGLPAIGPVETVEGLFVATGHYRNGVLLAESTGRLVADCVFGRVDPLLGAFSPSRFHASAHPAPRPSGS